MKLDKELIRSNLNTDDITLILSELGSSSPIFDKEKNPIYTTVCHDGNSHKLYYYVESKKFHCYSGCQTNYDIYELVMKVNNTTFPKALNFVAQVTGKFFRFRGKLAVAI